MMNLFLRPNEFIKKLKFEKSLGKTIGFLILNCIIFGLFGMLEAGTFLRQNLIVGALGMIIVSLLSTVILAGMISVIMRVFTGKSNFRGAMNAFVFSMFIIGISAILFALLSRIPAIGVLLGLIVNIFMFVYAFAFLYKSISAFYDIDMMSVFIALSIIAFVGAVLVFAQIIVSLFKELAYLL